MFEAIYDLYDEIILNWTIIQQAMAPLRLTRWQMFKLFLAEINRDNPLLVKIVLLLTILFWFSVGLRIHAKLKNRKVLAVPPLGYRLKGELGKSGQKEPRLESKGDLQFLVYPPSSFDEIKRLPETDASAQDYLRIASHGYFGHSTKALMATIALDLSKSVPLAVGLQQMNTSVAFDRFLGYCVDFRTVPLADLLTKTVASTHASLFLGREFGGGDWPILLRDYLSSFSAVKKVLDRMPHFLLPIARPLSYLATRRAKGKMRGQLEPLIRGEMELQESTGSLGGKGEDSKGRLALSPWLRSRYSSGGATHSRLLSGHIDFFTLSPLTCAALLSSIIVELAKRPHVQDELYQEIDSILVQGQLPSTQLKELRKLDSVMRETARLHAFSPYALCRRTQRPLQLSSGPLLPVGCIVCVDAVQINHSAKIFSEPEDFEADRFLRMRSQSGAEQSHQFSSTGPGDPSWGDGVQACPGRIFANQSLKVSLAHIISKYRFKLDASRSSLSTMGKTSTVGDMFPVDAEIQVLFKSRQS